MLKNRLIFTLLMKNGSYQLSRNFNLQDVGDLAWIKKYYNFNAIAFSIDELIVLDVERGGKNIKLFCENLLELNKNCFMPIAAGGGIKSIDDAYFILNSGADKLVINSALKKNNQLVTSLVETFGSQCVIASIDYKKYEDQSTEVFIENGNKPTGKTVEEFIKISHDLGCGEIYLTSMEQDGTGYGFDIDTLKSAEKISSVPIIASGGAGKYQHFADGILIGNASAVSTANLFNFIANGLIKVREKMIENSIEMAKWEFGFHDI